MTKTITKLSLVLFVTLSISGKKLENKISQTQLDTIKDNNLKINTNTQKNKEYISNYKKATDSILNVADGNNLNAKKELDDIKNYHKELIQKDLKIKEIKNQLFKNIDILIKSKKVEEQLTIKTQNHKTKKMENINIVSVDSVFVDGNIFRKKRWDYVLTLANGETKIIKNVR